MRESIGSAWLLIIVMTFITLFSGYLAFSINYSKSFRVKDGIVERIQKHNGLVKSGSKSTLKEIDDFLAEIGYNAKGNCYKFCDGQGNDYAGINGTTFKQNPSDGELFNYCLIKVRAYQSGSNVMTSSYYKVIVFFSLRIGSISLLSSFHTQGETQTLYYATDDYFR